VESWKALESCTQTAAPGQSRIRENLEIFDFELTKDEMAILSGLSSGGRIGPDPETFDVV
jgi:diketogulonate reductase-like aldo/keto reductase